MKNSIVIILIIVCCSGCTGPQQKPTEMEQADRTEPATYESSKDTVIRFSAEVSARLQLWTSDIRQITNNDTVFYNVYRHLQVLHDSTVMFADDSTIFRIDGTYAPVYQSSPSSYNITFCKDLSPPVCVQLWFSGNNLVKKDSVTRQ